jgi:hypothetical protein
LAIAVWKSADMAMAYQTAASAGTAANEILLARAHR